MKTILKKGTKKRKEDIVYIRKCHNCGTKFTYQMRDIDYSFIHEMDYVDCPECEASNFIIINYKYRGRGEKNKKDSKE